MIRTVFAAAALAVAALLPGVAAAATDDRWSVDYDEDADICWMEQTYDLGDGATSSIGVDLPWESGPLLVMRNSGWNMAEGDTSAEVWFSGDWERAADVTVPARYHHTGTTTHVDLTLDNSQLERLGGTDTIVVRLAGGTPFERYQMGPTRAALDSLLECFDTFY